MSNLSKESCQQAKISHLIAQTKLTAMKPINFFTCNKLTNAVTFTILLP